MYFRGNRGKRSREKTNVVTVYRDKIYINLLYDGLSYIYIYARGTLLFDVAREFAKIYMESEYISFWIKAVGIYRVIGKSCFEV